MDNKYKVKKGDSKLNYGYIAYLLKDSDIVVLGKSQIKNVKDEDFENNIEKYRERR